MLFGWQAVWQYSDGKARKKIGTRGLAALELAYQEKKPYTEWIDKHGVKHKASLKDWKIEFNGKLFILSRLSTTNIDSAIRERENLCNG